MVTLQLVDDVTKRDKSSPRASLSNGNKDVVSKHEHQQKKQRSVRFPAKAVVEFTAATCAVLENEGHVRIGVKREGDISRETSIGSVLH